MKKCLTILTLSVLLLSAGCGGKSPETVASNGGEQAAAEETSETVSAETGDEKMLIHLTRNTGVMLTPIQRK